MFCMCGAASGTNCVWLEVGSQEMKDTAELVVCHKTANFLQKPDQPCDRRLSLYTDLHQTMSCSKQLHRHE